MARKNVNPMSVGTSFSPEKFEDIESQLSDMMGISGAEDNGIHRDNLDDLLNQDRDSVTTDENDQRILASQFLMGSECWPYLVELMDKIERDAKKQFESADTDTDNQLRIRWRAYKAFRDKVVAAIETAANTPLSTQLPTE